MKLKNLVNIAFFLLLFQSYVYQQDCSKNSNKNVKKLNLAYIVLHDDHNNVKAVNMEKIQKRLNTFSSIINRETNDNLSIECTPIYYNVRSLGLNKLTYSTYTFFEWMDQLFSIEKLQSDYDIISFTPLIDIPWADDSHSIGFYYKNKVCFSMEYYAYNQKDNVQSIALMIHKMFHGYGYNHQNIKMPALKLLNWELGLPVNVGLEKIMRDKYGYQAFFFSQHILNVLDNRQNNKEQNNHCLDNHGLVSKSCPYRKGITGDAYGSYCYDADHDGIVDDKDDYFLSSPISGKDSDEDGVVDDIDLIPWNNITVSGNIDAGKINLIGKQDVSRITFTSNRLNIFEIKTIYMERGPVNLKPDHFPGFFPQKNCQVIKSNSITLKKDLKKTPLVRIEVYYEFNHEIFFRPYYFFFPGTPVTHIICEREWYYFLRYGADIPKDINFYYVNRYDRDYNGILDNTRYKYFEIPDTYDWDGDGFPDLIDTLPTVYGKFQNDFVCGVKDSDHDGLADPGCLDFTPPDNWIPQYYYFGEIQRIIGKNLNFDRSPYLKGSIKNNGFPVEHFNSF